MTKEFYEERVLRYRVMRRQIITDPQQRAEYAINGYDPDDNWSLIWSFNNEADAIAQAEDDREIFKEPNWIVAVKDAGQETVIRRELW